jgi:Domain of unknown function (DUF4396)
MHEMHRSPPSVNRLAATATTHCLTGCAVGEVLGLVIAGAIGLGMLPAMALGIALAFVFGYAFTLVPLVRSGMAVRAALPLALAGDTISITVMEVVDNALMLLIPGAMAAGLASGKFWLSLAIALVVAFVLTVPVNRWLISRGRGHAAVHELHHAHH